MRLLFVYYLYGDGGSVQDLHGYTRAARALGHEVKVYGPESSLRCDIRGEAYQELQGLLAKHQKNRPPKEKG